MKCVLCTKNQDPNIFHDKNLLKAILMSFNFILFIYFFFFGGGGGGGGGGGWGGILAIDVHCHTRSVSCLSIEKRLS